MAVSGTATAARRPRRPGTNVDFWRKKFDENIARDRRDIEALQAAGWRVAVVWSVR
jgi:DNA mismatch endonuclease (patch repair protein)